MIAFCIVLCCIGATALLLERTVRAMLDGYGLVDLSGAIFRGCR